MSKSIGVIGNTGRMGRILTGVIGKHKNFINGAGFSRSQTPYISMDKVFQQNDYIIDFSQPGLVEETLRTAVSTPKPLVICTTGWPQEEMQEIITTLAQKVPVVIASNTSIGACVQRYLVRQLAKILGDDYDIDIMEKHHRHKIDIPSGTASSLLADIRNVKKEQYGLSYQTYHLKEGPRPEHFIGMAVGRSGNIPGDHEVSFTSLDDMISVKHVAFDRALFAKGAIRVVEWLESLKPVQGIYTMEDILNLK